MVPQRARGHRRRDPDARKASVLLEHGSELTGGEERATQMIRSFSDHAANERTFLAWVRTAIAIMAFGFLVARFNLFLRVAAQSLAAGAGRTTAMSGGTFGVVAGPALIIVGVGMIALAAGRFIRTSHAIDSAEQQMDGARMDLALAGMMIALGIGLLLYMFQALVPPF